MTPAAPLSEPELSSRMLSLAHDLNGLHARDVLAVAGFLTAQAFRCWPPDERVAEAEHWCHTLLRHLRESLD